MSGQRPPPTDGLVPSRVCPARPVMGTWARLGSRWARLPHDGLAGKCALCVFSLCKSCFIRDIDLCGPMAWFPGAYVLRALSWVHVRVWGAAGRGCHTPTWPGPPASCTDELRQRSISRIKHDLHRKNAQSARSPAKPVCGSRAQRLPRRAHVPMIWCAGHTRLGTRPSVGGGRYPE